MMADEINAKAQLSALKDEVKKAWHTAALLPDIAKRFRGHLCGAWLFPIVREWGDYKETWLKEVPTPEDISIMEVVMEWMVWLRLQPNGDVALKRIIGWAVGVPWHVLAARERRSERTIQNRIDRSLAAILKEFMATSVDIESIDEPELSPGRMRGFMAPLEDGESHEPPAEVMQGKVFIAGIGFMFRGKKYRSSYDVSEEACGKRRR